AKRGCSVLLIEKSCILGGLATLGLINTFVPMCNGRGKQIIFGLAEKWLREGAKYGCDKIPEEWENGEPKEPTNVRYIQRYSPYIFALQLNEELQSSGADLLFDCVACEPVMEGKICCGVITQSKAGLEYYSCRMLIDVTGDCDILRRAGVPTVVGESFSTYVGQMISLESCAKALEEKDISKAFGKIAGGEINYFEEDHQTDISMRLGLSTEKISNYLIRNQIEILEKLQSSDRFERDVVRLPMMPQIRTTSHLLGDYTFSEQDAYKHFEDSVCAINHFGRRGVLFEVPLRALCRGDYPNILTAGRSASAAGYGWDILRVIPPAILTGQAAGEAAYLALHSSTGISGINIKKLQTNLERENVMVHFPDDYISSED
ncbi:MAG: FAD-dependent oxidoreductase, partial [Clostridia bacterium]|nr:FAD-dependent oxidoreductase [Clostridia bacterium]